MIQVPKQYDSKLYMWVLKNLLHTISRICRNTFHLPQINSHVLGIPYKLSLITCFLNNYRCSQILSALLSYWNGSHDQVILGAQPPNL